MLVISIILICITAIAFYTSPKKFKDSYISKFNDKFSKYFRTPNSTPASSRKPSYSSNEPLKDPTPLMITPDQVKNYDDRPWRPFRWPYHQTMSIFKLDMNHWLDMDKYYWRYIEEKKRIWMTYGKENIDWLPEGYEPSFELMQIVTDHMLKRYPLLFTLVEDKGEAGGKIVYNELTKETLDMTLPLKEQPLLYVSKMAKEDFYVVLKNPKDDLHYLVAAAVPFPGGSFGIDSKLGQHLDVIHEDVPYYKEKLKRSMERWFDRLTPNDPVERASWYISWDHKLKVNNVYQLPKFVPDLKADMESMDPKDFNVRVERQTLRKLPKSGAIIFTNHPVFYSIEEMKDEPLVPSLIRKILYEGPQDIIKYKNFDFFRDYIVGYLDSLVKRQIDLGIISEDTPLKTLPTYPFAHWSKTDFDLVNGWNNPKEKVNYLQKAKEEKVHKNQ
ncbi:hypothetical protein CLIB1423_19S00188 [[Candida] railenensis]|uniref:Uncharacterized protein n=1 Tax=[Candida] railenensis TaxID=45579 RepID=A0A9P0VZC6_9ASCO|nr:hypothetical protein CLIB1423_19S00188 [[Candida] railenensis]